LTLSSKPSERRSRVSPAPMIRTMSKPFRSTSGRLRTSLPSWNSKSNAYAAMSSSSAVRECRVKVERHRSDLFSATFKQPKHVSKPGRCWALAASSAFAGHAVPDTSPDFRDRYASSGAANH
jgi:hypothetical protein